MKNFPRTPSGSASRFTGRVVRIALVGAGVISVAALAQVAGRTTWQGVFTAEQADHGKAGYTQHCVSCHGPALMGADVVPALAAATFASSWNGTSAADLFNRIHDSMPLNDPGSLRPAEVADIEAYILMSNGFPAGTSTLTD